MENKKDFILHYDGIFKKKKVCSNVWLCQVRDLTSSHRYTENLIQLPLTAEVFDRYYFLKKLTSAGRTTRMNIKGKKCILKTLSSLPPRVCIFDKLINLFLVFFGIWCSVTAYWFSSVKCLMFVAGRMALRRLQFSLLSRKCYYSLPVKIFTSFFDMNNSQQFKKD